MQPPAPQHSSLERHCPPPRTQHRPLSQPPPQHVSAPAQLVPATVQVQRPPVHVPPQHCALLVHSPPPCTQQAPRTHAEPAQQSWSSLQCSPVPLQHCPVPLRLRVQFTPPQQSLAWRQSSDLLGRQQIPLVQR
jgi:hypothetical protein